MSFSTLISDFAQIIASLLLAIAQLVIFFVLAVVAGVLYIVRALTPVLLRAGCIALFMFGWLQGVLGTNALYTQLTDAVGALFVAAALGVVLIALPVRSLLSLGENVWSAFALAGLVGFGCAWVCAQAQSNEWMQWIARGLPVSLAASGLIYIAVTNKYRRAVRESQHAE